MKYALALCLICILFASELAGCAHQSPAMPKEMAKLAPKQKEIAQPIADIKHTQDVIEPTQNLYKKNDTSTPVTKLNCTALAKNEDSLTLDWSKENELSKKQFPLNSTLSIDEKECTCTDTKLGNSNWVCKTRPMTCAPHTFSVQVVSTDTSLEVSPTQYEFSVGGKKIYTGSPSGKMLWLLENGNCDAEGKLELREKARMMGYTVDGIYLFSEQGITLKKCEEHWDMGENDSIANSSIVGAEYQIYPPQKEVSADAYLPDAKKLRDLTPAECEVIRKEDN